MNNKYIPIIVESYPDELLYSWIVRLAKINELSNRMFFETYLEEPNVKKRPIQIDIRRGYRNFYKTLNIDIDMMELYFQLSTTQFELSFVPTRQQIKVLHNVLRNESELNYISNYFIQRPKVCLECMKEDVDKYGEPYIHRTHQLSGVVACHKHRVPLYYLNKKYKSKHDYDFENITEKVCDVTDYDYKYAEYANQLLVNNLSSNSDILMAIISDRLKEILKVDTLSKQELAHNIANLLNNPKKEKAIFRHNETLSSEETIKVLLYLFPNVEEFLSRLPSYEMTIKKHCNVCNRDYYITHQAIQDGWGCTYCDDEMDEIKLLKRLIKNIGDNEFTFKEVTSGKKKQLILHHKLSNRDLSTQFARFMFENIKHPCTLLRSKKEAEARISKHKHFKLIEYSGVTKPAKFYHDVCGQTFEVSTFDVFTSNPICRCCESKPNFDLDIFKQQVKDLVGDEYEVLGYQREDISYTVTVTIKHKECGSIKTLKAWNFLTGERCSKCRSLIRKEHIEEMLKEYSDNRYIIVGDVDKQKVTVLDTKTNKEMVLRLQHIVQEMVRPTPSLIFEFNNKERKQISSWDTWYQLCIEYREGFGHLCPKRGERYKDKLFSRWCEEQRQLYNKGLLSEEKISKLQELDFVFDVVFYKWNQKFEEYKEFVKDTGILLPQESTIHNGNKVGKWVFSQRCQKTRGRLNPIYEELLLEFNPNFFKRLK